MGNRSFPFNMWLYRNKSLSPSGLSHVQEDPCPVVACRQDLLSFEIIHTVKSINWILFLWKTVPSASTKGHVTFCGSLVQSTVWFGKAPFMAFGF